MDSKLYKWRSQKQKRYIASRLHMYPWAPTGMGWGALQPEKVKINKQATRCVVDIRKTQSEF